MNDTCHLFRWISTGITEYVRLAKMAVNTMNRRATWKFHSPLFRNPISTTAIHEWYTHTYTRGVSNRHCSRMASVVALKTWFIWCLMNFLVKWQNEGFTSCESPPYGWVHCRLWTMWLEDRWSCGWVWFLLPFRLSVWSGSVLAGRVKKQRI